MRASARFGRDLQRLFDQDVQAVPRGGDSLFTVQARRAADGHEVHRSMREKSVEVVVGDGVVLPGEMHGLLGIAAIHGGNLEPGHAARRANVCVGDAARADEPYMHGWNSSECCETLDTQIASA